MGALARRIGWDKSRLSRYENSQVGLSVDAIEQIAQALELPPLVVALRCLKHIYPALSDPTKKPGKILERVVAEVLAEHKP